MSNCGAYVEAMAQHEAWVRKISDTEWEAVCPACPGQDVALSALRRGPALTSTEQAQHLADFHRQLYSDLGDRILRRLGGTRL
jgi:hypothetical protein